MFNLSIHFFCTLLCCCALFLSHAPSAAAASNSTLVAGGAHAAVIASDGTIWAWGYNGHGQLGSNNSTYSTTPVKVPAPLSPVSLAAGFKRTLVLDIEGKVWTWGATDPQTPKNLFIRQIPVTDISQIALGPSDEALLLNKNSTVWSWSGFSDKPVLIKNLDDVAGVGVGVSSYFAFKYDCSLMAWGRNTFGQLGDGTMTNQSQPVPSSIFACLSAIAIDNHTIALDFEGNLWSWGYNREGQLGTGTTVPQALPEQLPNLSNIVAIDADRHTLALKSDGTVWAWGKNNFGQLGDGTTADRPQPVQVKGLQRVQSIAAGAMFSVAVKADGSVWAWGNNNYGQLGNGTLDNSSVPIQVKSYDGYGFLNRNDSSKEKEVPPVYFSANPLKGNAPLKVTFTPKFPSNFTPKSVEWDFGDGDISNQKSPTHIYQTAGAYIVTLTTRYQGDIYRESMKQIVVKSSW